MKLFFRCTLAWILFVFGPLLWLNENGWRFHQTVNRAQLTADESFAFDAPLAVPRLFDDGSDGPRKATSSNLRLFEDDKELGPPHSAHATIRSAGHGAFSHWVHTLKFSSSDGTSPLANGRSYRAELVAYPNPQETAIATAIPIAALAVIFAVCGLALLWRTPRPAEQLRAWRAGLTPQIDSSPRDWLKLAGLTIAYGIALFLISISLEVQQDGTGGQKINFEYKVF